LGGQSWPTTCNNRCAGRPAARQNAACRPPSDRAAARRCRRPARRAPHGRQPGPDTPARCAPRRAARLKAPRSAGHASCTSCMTARRRATSSATCTSPPAARAAPRGAACARRARRPACASSRWGSWRAWRWSSCRTASRPPGCCARCRTTRARSSPRRPAPRFPTPRNVCPPTTAHVPVAARGTRAESALHEAITEAREQALPGSGAGAHQAPQRRTRVAGSSAPAPARALIMCCDPAAPAPARAGRARRRGVCGGGPRAVRVRHAQRPGPAAAVGALPPGPLHRHAVAARQQPGRVEPVRARGAAARAALAWQALEVWQWGGAVEQAQHLSGPGPAAAGSAAPPEPLYEGPGAAAIATTRAHAANKCRAGRPLPCTADGACGVVLILACCPWPLARSARACCARAWRYADALCALCREQHVQGYIQ